jgi:TolB protein
MDADGSGQRRLTYQRGDDSHPHWSPDGKRIIFNSARATPDPDADWSKQHIELFSMNANGSDVRQITNFKTISTYPSWSPDGSKIVFRMVTSSAGFQWDLRLGTRNSEVYVVDADGRNPVNLSQSAAYDGWPAWSPEGKKVVFASNRTGPANTAQVFLVNPDGTGLEQISDGKYSYAQPAWSKDGKKIFVYQNWEFSNIEFGHIWVLQF